MKQYYYIHSTVLLLVALIGMIVSQNIAHYFFGVATIASLVTTGSFATALVNNVEFALRDLSVGLKAAMFFQAVGTLIGALILTFVR